MIGISEGIVLADRYRLVRRQIERGIGATWIAADTETGSDVWVQFSDDGGLAEAAALIQELDHPAVPRVLDTGELRLIVDSRAVARTAQEDAGHSTHVEIVIEFVVAAPPTGRALTAKIVRRALSPTEALTIAALLAGALEPARAAGRSHGWLTADSVWLVRRGGYVADLALGLAFPDGPQIGVEQLVTGYFAAERITGGASSEAADVYALGWLVYEMLIGHSALQAEYATLVEGAGAVTTVELLALWRARARAHVLEILESGAPLAVLLTAALAEEAEDRPDLGAFQSGARAAAQQLAGVGPLVEFGAPVKASKAAVAAVALAGAAVGAELAEIAELAAESGTAAGAGSEAATTGGATRGAGTVAAGAGAAAAGAALGSVAGYELASEGFAGTENASGAGDGEAAASAAESAEEAAGFAIGSTLGFGAAGVAMAAGEFESQGAGAQAGATPGPGAGEVGAVTGSASPGSGSQFAETGSALAAAGSSSVPAGSVGGTLGHTGAHRADHHIGRRRKVLIATASAVGLATFAVGLVAGYEWGHGGGSANAVAAPAGSGVSPGAAASASPAGGPLAVPAAASASAACNTPAAAAASTETPSGSAGASASSGATVSAPTSNGSAFAQLHQTVRSAESAGSINAATGGALANAIGAAESAAPGTGQWSSALSRLSTLIQSGQGQGTIPESVANQLATTLSYLYAANGS